MDEPDRTTSDAAARAAASERAKPRTVGRYEILEEIGRGGMGIVYKARQRDLDRLVALKELRSVHAAAPDLVRRFVRESRLTSSLNHPNIVTVYDYVEESDTSFIAIEYMPRGSLRSLVGELSLAQFAGVLEGLLAGLSAVEPSGIVHRDLKPENVMVSGDGRVKIADFGIAKATQSASAASFMTGTGITVGTPAYMAPEQALSDAIGPWTDLYSVGVMAYEQLVGQLPFKGSSTPVAVLLRHVNESIPPVIDSRPDLDRSLSEWVGRLLVKEPARRTSSAIQAWEELEEILIELLGARWRRDARLPEPGSLASSSRPLTPAPFDSRSLEVPEPSPDTPLRTSSPQGVSRQPEAESGFLPYGRGLTGAEWGSPPVSPDGVSGDLPTSANRQDSSQHSQETADKEVLAGEGRDLPLHGRRMAVVALLTALAAAAGFVLVPAGGGAKSPVPKASGSAAAPHGPNQAYAATLNDVMARLNSLRAGAGAQLAHAKTPQEQASAALHLAQAQEQAAEAVQKAPTRSSEQVANTAVASALGEMGDGYSTMAAAAGHEDGRGFEDGRKTVSSATHALAVAFAQLHELGYRLAG
jgi:serine/threonine protein kinase